ncbi:Bug family tripartite tricarboxylate transporter substrate binding protein [Algihabitans albus]|uniref:Bug family tripartite tricarboxylate transporter substrate binding protein n=1 Tax=Algihabitans albus TaxID=2164067 RepID=UPI000E5C8E22|nr:tripartite tricarboxylate transporter substrate-binding protein [Algihabitans albus]
MHGKPFVAFAALASLTLASTLGTDAAKADDWEPNKPFEMVIMAGQGGGADRLARLFQSIIQKNDLSPMPVLPINKGGGSGAEALRYLQDNAGDPHKVMATLNSYYTTPLRTDIGVDIAEFTPLARMAVDTFVLWVSADSDIETLEDYVAAVKAAGGAWKMGGTGTGQEDSLVTAMLEKEFGVEMTYVPFAGGGTVAKNLVGGHVDSTVNNPSEQMAFWKAGKSRPIATFTEDRIQVFSDVPTMRELGHDLVYTMQRSFVGPPDMPAAAQDFYVRLLIDLSKTEEWQSYAAEQALVTDLLTGEELQAYLLTERDLHEKLLSEMDESGS